MRPVINVGILGATSLVGPPLVASLVRSGRLVLACSRHAHSSTEGVTWCRPGDSLPVAEAVSQWVALCPPWATVDAFSWLARAGCTRLVALSSTSVLTKQQSPDAVERRLAEQLAVAEDSLSSAAASAGITLVILRPTMIYDGHSDGNISRIAAFARRFGCFPVCGKASGLRQPVHADDVALACVSALEHAAPQSGYTLSGGEALMFRDVIVRTCLAHGLSPRLIAVPLGAWRLAAVISRPFELGITAGIATRMNDDLSCDHADASRDLGFRPRGFEPAPSRTDPFIEAAPNGVAQ